MVYDIVYNFLGDKLMKVLLSGRGRRGRLLVAPQRHEGRPGDRLPPRVLQGQGGPSKDRDFGHTDKGIFYIFFLGGGVVREATVE